MRKPFKNSYVRHSYLNEKKFKEILRCFSLYMTACDTTILTKVSRQSISKLFDKIRQRIFELTKMQAAKLGEFETDESYFGAQRVRGKRGRGAAGKKTPVFGILTREGRMFVKVVQNCSKSVLMPVIKEIALEWFNHSFGQIESL